MLIRQAHWNDITQIEEILWEMHQEAGIEMAPVDEDKASGVIQNVLKNGILLVAEKDEKIVGSLGLLFDEPWWSRKRHLADVWFYVLKNERKSSAGMRLLRTAVDIAKLAKTPLHMAVFYGQELERKDWLYQRLGFEKVGGVYIMES